MSCGASRASASPNGSVPSAVFSATTATKMPFVGQVEQLGDLPRGPVVAHPAGDERLDQRRAVPIGGDDAIRHRLAVRLGERDGVLVGAGQDRGGGVGQRPHRAVAGGAGLGEQLLPQEREPEPVGAQQLGQRHPLLGAALAGAPRRTEIGIIRCGHRAEHEREVVAHRAAQLDGRDDRLGPVEVDLGGDAFHEPLDELVEPQLERGRQGRHLGMRSGPCHPRRVTVRAAQSTLFRRPWRWISAFADPRCMDLDNRIGDSLSTDYFLLRTEFTPTQLDYLTRTRTFVEEEVLPEINGYWERAEFPRPLVEKLGEVGIVGDGIAGYGCPDLDPLSAGLITMELSRGDGSLGHVRRRAGGPRHALDRHAGLRGAEAALAAADGPAGEARRVRAHRARPRLRLHRAGDHRPPRRRRTGSSTATRSGSATAASPTSSWCGPATSPTARSRASSWRRAPPATTPA